MQMTLTRRRRAARASWLSALVAALVLAGCEGAASLDVAPVSAVATPATSSSLDIRDIDTHHVFAELSVADRLDAAAAELAVALGVPTEEVRARAIPGGCTLCTSAENGGNADPTGMDVAAAAAEVQSGDLIHLFVGRFVCIFSFDGARFAPQSCHITSF